MMTALVAILGAAIALALARSARRSGTTRRIRTLQGASVLALPGPIRRHLDRLLGDAGVRTTPEAAVGWWTLGSVSAALIGAAMGPVTAIVAIVGAIAAGPLVIAHGKARTRRALDHAVPELLERAATELRSGGTVLGALMANDDASPLRLGEITTRIELGSSFADSMVAWAARLDRDDTRAAAGALGLAGTVGGRAANALDGLAASLRARLAALADAQAQAAQARLSALVVGAAPIAFLAFSAVTDPAALTALVGTSFGRACLAAGLVLQALAAIWIRRIVTSEP